MMHDKIRWGILGAAEIARKNWKAIRNSGNSTVVAVASRDRSKAARFIAECQIEAPMETAPRPLGSYAELIEDREIDAVYIPLPTGIRKEWVMRAARVGKHIVCEKPCAACLEDLREMLECCRVNRVQFMDGVMFMHGKRLDRIHGLIQEGKTLGELKRITSAFSFRGAEEFFAGNIRVNGLLEPLGCLGDLGWYCIRFTLAAMNWQSPKRAAGRILRSVQSADRGVPVEFSGDLFFEKGVSASFYCSFVTAIEQWVVVSGTRGLLRISDFVLPFFGDESSFEVSNPIYDIRGCDFNMEPHWRKFSVPEYSNSHPSAQETNLFRNFANQLLAGGLNEFWPDAALKTQQAMDACWKSARDGSRLVDVPS